MPYTLLSENQYFPIEASLTPPPLIVLVSRRVGWPSFPHPQENKPEPICSVLVAALPDTRCCAEDSFPDNDTAQPLPRRHSAGREAQPGCYGSSREDKPAPEHRANKGCSSPAPKMLLQVIHLFPGLTLVPSGWNPRPLVPFLWVSSPFSPDSLPATGGHGP